MLKHILSLVLSLLLLEVAKAENPDSLIIYLKNSGQKVASKDSADYIRIVLPPDSTVDKDLYRVFEYYLNGKRKSVATSLALTPVILDGPRIEYFQNGKRKSSAQFKEGGLNGPVINYYPNGKLYFSLNVEELTSGYYNGYYTERHLFGFKRQIIELRDSIGNLLVEKGAGHVVEFDDDFKKVVEEGDLKNNKREGEWRGTIADSGKFICVYHNDKLKSGISYMKSGHHYTFNQVITAPVFSDGMEQFFYFIKKNLQYPESAKIRKIQGTVVVGFDVETNGTLSDIKVDRSLLKSMDDEAIRVISLSPLWIPATKFGVPIRARYTYRVNFNNF